MQKIVSVIFLLPMMVPAVTSRWSSSHPFRPQRPRAEANKENLQLNPGSFRFSAVRPKQCKRETQTAETNSQMMQKTCDPVRTSFAFGPDVFPSRLGPVPLLFSSFFFLFSFLNDCLWTHHRFLWGGGGVFHWIVVFFFSVLITHPGEKEQFGPPVSNRS